MARPSLGAEARTVQAGLKITEQEQVSLEAEFGSVGKGLRVLLDNHRRVLAAEKGHPTTGFGVTDAQIADDITRTLIPHEHQGHPMLDDDVAARDVDDLEVQAALMLDAVSRSMEVAAYPTPDHRHRRGTLLRTVGSKGVMERVYACAFEGCTKELS